MGQDIFDLIVVLTLAYLTVRGVGNGFVGEAAGIFSLIGGFWIARSYNAQLAPYLQFISNPGWRTIAAWAILFIATIIAVGIVAHVLKRIVAFSFVAWADRLAGGLFGLAKGILIWTIIFIILERFFNDATFLQQSRVYPYFVHVIKLVKQWLPPELAGHIGL